MTPDFINIDTIWVLLKDHAIVGRVCFVASCLLLVCFGIKLVIMFYFEKGRVGTMPNFTYVFITVGVLAALITGPMYSFICESVVIPLFKSATGMLNERMGIPKGLVVDLYDMIRGHEGDAVSFFNPKVWNANTTVLLFSFLLNITGVLMFVSLILGPLYLFFCIVGGPIVIAMSILLGPKFLTKWFMMIVAAVFIQIFVGVAFMVISDNLGAVSALAEGVSHGAVAGVYGSSLELALVMIILCAVVVLAVPMVHGYVFGSAFMFVFPVVIGAFAAMFDGCVSLVSAAVFSMQSKKSERAV